MSDDRQWLAEFCRNGSDAAFRQLVRQHLNLVYSAAMRMVNGDSHQAQDVAQLVFANLARQARSLPANVVLAGWLHRDTRFTALEWLRQERRRVEREREAATMRELETAGEVEWSHLRPILDEILDELRDDDRHALLLRFFEQQSLAQVGGALGIAEEAARKRVSRALEQLRGVLAGRGIHSTAEVLTGTFTARALMVAPAGLAAAVATAALAGATTAAASGNGTMTVLKFMTMTKIKLGLVGAIAVAGIATPLVIQHQSQVKLRADNQALRQQVDQMEKVTAENKRLVELAAQAGQSQSVPADPSHDLLRLRGEIGVLRQQNQELAKLLLDRQKSGATPGEAGDFEPSSSWADAGLATPEAAAGTFAWAAKTLNTNKLAEVLLLPESAGTNSAEIVMGLAIILQPGLAQIKASRLVSVDRTVPDEVTFLFQNQLSNGDVQTGPLTLKRVGTDWKVKLPLVMDASSKTRAGIRFKTKGVGP